MKLSKPWIKVCGITCAEDLELLIRSGATAVGINLWPKSPRSVTSDMALHLTKLAKGRIETVWVTVDMALDELLSLVQQGAPTWVQLHGDQPAEYIKALGDRAFYAVGIQDEGHVEEALSALGSFVLVDARDEIQKGGTGKLAPLALAAQVSAGREMVLAGGLNPDNVGARIASVMPAGVDTASGVESVPGRKDPAKVRLFCEQARRAFAQL
jgi:phosphoribosylanthranilate isomerase